MTILNYIGYFITSILVYLTIGLINYRYLGVFSQLNKIMAQFAKDPSKFGLNKTAKRLNKIIRCVQKITKRSRFIEQMMQMQVSSYFATLLNHSDILPVDRDRLNTDRVQALQALYK